MSSQSLESAHVYSDEFNPTIVTVPRPKRHYCYLNDANGDWLSTIDGQSLFIQGHVDDAAIWDPIDGGFQHVRTGLRLAGSATTVGQKAHVSIGDGQTVSETGQPGESAEFSVGHGPELLPSAYLEFLKENGWVSITCILPPGVVDGLQRVGCVDDYEGRDPVRLAPLVQDAAVAQCTAEPISLWLTREYIQMKDIKLGHSPGITALTKDDGQREVQGWHTDFPYLWGTGDRIPLPSGDLVLGMQRNVCVSDFNRENGATLFKLGSHSSMTPPPETWGLSRHTYRKGHRAKFGLPYAGEDADLIEAPAGTIILYDARTWHRAGLNFTDSKRGAIIQAIVPGFIIPFMDTSSTFKSFLESAANQQVTECVRKEIDKLMVHKIMGPAGMYAITTDKELTERARKQQASAYSSVY